MLILTITNKYYKMPNILDNLRKLSAARNRRLNSAMSIAERMKRNADAAREAATSKESETE